MRDSNKDNGLPSEGTLPRARATRRSTAPRVGMRVAAGLAGAAMLLTGTLGAQTSDFDTDISIDELMEAVVMPQADAIWSAIQYASTEDGEKMIGPATDDEWLELRHSALTLAEVSNSLMVPGRHAAPAGAAANPGELAPAEIEALIDNQRNAWNGFAHILHGIAMETVAAIDERDADKIFLDVGGRLDEACESCHVVFWYPEQN
jgi:hypothetical protein